MDYRVFALLLNENIKSARLSGDHVFALAGAIVMLWQPETGFLLPYLTATGWDCQLDSCSPLECAEPQKPVSQYPAEIAGGMDGCRAGGIRLQPVLVDAVMRDISTETYLLLLGSGLIVFGLSMVVQYGLAIFPRIGPS